MTNEQIVNLIKKSKNDKYISVLWKKVRTLMYIKADKYYYSMVDKFKAYGIDPDDLKQELYFPFLEAIKAFKTDKNLKFVTYLEFPIKNAVNRIFNNKKSKYDSLNFSKSLDMTVSENDDINLSDVIEDENVNVFKKIEQNLKAEIIRNEVEKLSDNQKKVIKLYYFNNKTDCEISKILGTTSSNSFQIRRVALANLKKSPILNIIYYY